MTYPGPYPNGHKAWLESEADKGTKTKRAVCHAALYLGRVLEMLTWVQGRACWCRPEPPEWWKAQHPCPEEGMDDDGG